MVVLYTKETRLEPWYKCIESHGLFMVNESMSMVKGHQPNLNLQSYKWIKAQCSNVSSQ